MQELISFISQHGLILNNPTLDGSILRFPTEDKPRSMNGWLIGWQVHGTNGEPYIVAVMGNWRTGEKFEYKTDRKYSKEDKIIIKEKLKEANKKIEKERTTRNREAELKALERWDKAKDNTKAIHPYLAKKQISECEDLGIKYDSNDNILIPIRDIDNKLVGIQTVYGDGGKFFMPGQKIKGCFHHIGEFTDETRKVFLAEGFATAASIYMATGTTTIVAFNAKNLINVAAELNKKYESLGVVVCADDDFETTNHKGEKINTGIECAEKASILCGSKFIKPEFKAQKSGETDFNDLHVAESIQTVANQLRAAPRVSKNYVCLGFENGNFYFYSSKSKSIIKTRKFSFPSLYQLAPKSYWEIAYEGQRGTRWEDVKSDLIQSSIAVGIFNSSKIRGSGVWLDKKRVVINTGEMLIVDGEEMALNEIKSYYVYIQTKNSINSVSRKRLSTKDAQLLINVSDLLKWEHPSYSKLFSGWIAISRIAGALPVRPHVWVTGESGSGKSTVMNHIVEPCLGNQSGRLFLQGTSTEAGIRQAVSASSIPIIFDEFETDDRVSGERIKSILELLRQSWSITSGKIVKGSAAGESVEYSLCFAALVSSIRVGLKTQADRSRFSVLELDKNSTDDNWDMIQFYLKEFNSEYGEMLFARSCSLVSVIYDSYKVLQKNIANRNSQRLGQQTGMLLAGYHSLVSDDPITDSEAEELISSLGFEESKSEMSDQDELINHLMTTSVRMEILTPDSRNSRFAEVLISKAIDVGGLYHEELEKYGIIIKSGFAHILSNHAGLAKLLSNTKWANNWSRTLSRLEGARANQQIWISKDKKPARCTKINLKYL